MQTKVLGIVDKHAICFLMINNTQPMQQKLWNDTIVTDIFVHAWEVAKIGFEMEQFPCKHFMRICWSAICTPSKSQWGVLSQKGKYHHVLSSLKMLMAVKLITLNISNYGSRIGMVAILCFGDNWTAFNLSPDVIQGA